MLLRLERWSTFASVSRLGRQTMSRDGIQGSKGKKNSPSHHPYTIPPRIPFTTKEEAYRFERCLKLLHSENALYPFQTGVSGL